MIYKEKEYKDNKILEKRKNKDKEIIQKKQKNNDAFWLKFMYFDSPSNFFIIFAPKYKK